VTCGLSYTYRVYAQETGEVDSPYTDEASRIACTQPASISTATHEASIEPDCPSEDNVWIEWTGSFNPGDLVLIERNSNGAGYVERFYIPASLGMKTDMWGRRTGAVSQTLQYRLTPYDSGVLPGTPVETTQSNELVSSKPCDERYT
jgi:hypothetical protein